MTISVGDKLPEATFMTMGADGPEPVTTADVFGGKRVALFAVPGAFTPTCSAKHLPGFKERVADFKRQRRGRHCLYICERRIRHGRLG